MLLIGGRELKKGGSELGGRKLDWERNLYEPACGRLLFLHRGNGNRRKQEAAAHRLLHFLYYFHVYHFWESKN